MIDHLSRLVIIVLGFLLSMVVSSLVIRIGIPLLKRAAREKNTASRPVLKWWIDIGFWIGFCETLIIFVFALNSEFGGLALIFGAKEFVRKDEIKNDPTYYLLGTVINFATALVILEMALSVISLTGFAVDVP